MQRRWQEELESLYASDVSFWSWWWLDMDATVIINSWPHPANLWGSICKDLKSDFGHFLAEIDLMDLLNGATNKAIQERGIDHLQQWWAYFHMVLGSLVLNVQLNHGRLELNITGQWVVVGCVGLVGRIEKSFLITLWVPNANSYELYHHHPSVLLYRDMRSCVHVHHNGQLMPVLWWSICTT